MHNRFVKSTCRLLALLTLLLPPAAFAECVTVVAAPLEVPRNVTVHLEYSGKPLQMPLSVIETVTRKTIREVTTDTDGKAEIRDLPPGIYEIRSPVASNISMTVLAKEGNYALDIRATIDQLPIILKEVRGTVMDMSGAVIPGAVAIVETIGPSPTPVDVGKTDQHGRISLKVPPGIYEIRIALPGFLTAAFPVQVLDNGWDGFRLTMQVGGCPAPNPSFIVREDVSENEKSSLR